jgi:hypothetical protein
MSTARPDLFSVLVTAHTLLLSLYQTGHDSAAFFIKTFLETLFLKVQGKRPS